MADKDTVVAVRLVPAGKPGAALVPYGPPALGGSQFPITKHCLGFRFEGASKLATGVRPLKLMVGSQFSREGFAAGLGTDMLEVDGSGLVVAPGQRAVRVVPAEPALRRKGSTLARQGAAVCLLAVKDKLQLSVLQQATGPMLLHLAGFSSSPPKLWVYGPLLVPPGLPMALGDAAYVAALCHCHLPGVKLEVVVDDDAAAAAATAALADLTQQWLMLTQRTQAWFSWRFSRRYSEVAPPFKRPKPPEASAAAAATTAAPSSSVLLLAVDGKASLPAPATPAQVGQWLCCLAKLAPRGGPVWESCVVPLRRLPRGLQAACKALLDEPFWCPAVFVFEGPGKLATAAACCKFLAEM